MGVRISNLSEYRTLERRLGSWGRRTQRALYLARTYRWLMDPRAWRLGEATRLDRPIFLLGLQGGGLTLLSRMLRRHPLAIGAAGGPTYWTGADEIQNVYELLLPPALSGIRLKAPPHPDLPPPRSWTYATHALLPAYRGRSTDATPALRKALRRVIGGCALRHAPRPERARFVDKSQTYTVRLGLLHALLSDVDPKFVLVTRDPYASVLRAAEGKAGALRRLSSHRSLAERVALAAEHWANSMRCALSDADQLGLALHVLKFEDLLADPEAALRAVCQATELEFFPHMVPGADQSLPWGSRFEDRWFPVRKDVNRPYLSRLQPWVTERVEAEAGELIDRLGYRRGPR